MKKKRVNPNCLLKKMAIKNRKSKKIQFGFFKSEKLAKEYIEHKKKHFPIEGEVSYYVVKRKRPKEGQNSFLAYCLVRK